MHVAFFRITGALLGFLSSLIAGYLYCLNPATPFWFYVFFAAIGAFVAYLTIHEARAPWFQHLSAKSQLSPTSLFTSRRDLIKGWSFIMVYKTVRLKDERTATLEWLKEKDLPELVEALNSVIREGKFLFMNNEIADMEEERKWFERSIKTGVLYLVARVDVRLVGGAAIHPHTDKRAHVAEFGIYLRKGYRNLGLGTALTKTFIEIAKKRGFEILQVSVFATNTRAFQVYKKCGYKECGRLTRDVKLLDGTYSDRILMELPLK